MLIAHIHCLVYGIEIVYIVHTRHHKKHHIYYRMYQNWKCLFVCLLAKPLSQLNAQTTTTNLFAIDTDTDTNTEYILAFKIFIANGKWVMMHFHISIQNFELVVQSKPPFLNKSNCLTDFPTQWDRINASEYIPNQLYRFI